MEQPLPSSPWWHHVRFYAGVAGVMLVYFVGFVIGVVALIGAVEAEFRFFGNVISTLREVGLFR